MCSIRNQKATKCVHIGVHVKISYVRRNTPQPCHLSIKLIIMISGVKTKLVVKFEASEMMCVELRAKKLRNMYTLAYMRKFHPHMYRTHLNHVTSPRNLRI